MSLRQDIQRLAYEFELEDGAAFDLWTWLPSYQVAKKYHGDYADNHRPSGADIMREAARVMAVHAGRVETEEEQARWENCPCGQYCEEQTVAPPPLAPAPSQVAVTDLDGAETKR